MNEEVQMVYEMAKEHMEKSIEHLDNELMRIRAGKANVHILDGVMVDYYGTPTPLNQVSNISTPDAKTIMIQNMYIGFACPDTIQFIIEVLKGFLHVLFGHLIDHLDFFIHDLRFSFRS